MCFYSTFTYFWNLRISTTFHCRFNGMWVPKMPKWRDLGSLDFTHRSFLIIFCIFVIWWLANKITYISFWCLAQGRFDFLFFTRRHNMFFFLSWVFLSFFDFALSFSLFCFLPDVLSLPFLFPLFSFSASLFFPSFS